MERDLSKFDPHKKQDRSIIKHATMIKQTQEQSRGPTKEALGACP
jgi:hypothetical protein